MKNLFKISGTTFTVFLLLVLFSSCKEDVAIGDSPYTDGPKPEVQFMDARPSPEEGSAGEEVTFQVSGLKGRNFTFYINQEEADVVSVSDSTITVIVPAIGSSGAASVDVEGKAFFGPIFNVIGKVEFAPSFEAFNGTDGPIYQILEKPDGSFLLVGNFTDYENNKDSDPINRIVQIDRTGAYMGDRITAGEGANGIIQTIARDSKTGKYYIGGIFGKFDVRSGINSITRLNTDASLDTMIVDLINEDPDGHPENDTDTVPTFNGGITGGQAPSMVKLFYDAGTEKVLGIGNFNQHNSIYYPRSTKDGKKIDRTPVNQLIRFEPEGGMDSSFNFNKAENKAYDGGNGFIFDAVRMPDGKLIIVGNFTTFNGKAVHMIARINDQDGSLDEDFQSGSGADGPISRITYNAVTDKILLTGEFNHFNGTKANGVVLLNSDGSVDNSFRFGETSQGRANFAGQLDNGLILVSGRFLSYEGVIRSGFMILNPDGSLASGYNNTGAFIGGINQIIESKTTLNEPGVIIVGSFSRFDNRKVGNIVKIALKP